MTGKRTYKCNTKIKIYPDGTRVATYGNRNIFDYDKPKENDNQKSANKKTNIEFRFPCGLCNNKIRYDPYFYKNQSSKYMLVYSSVLDDIGGISPKDFSDYLKNYSNPRQRKVKKPKSKDKSDKGKYFAVKRAMDKIYDLVALNEWTYFFTGTLGNTPFDPTSAKEALLPLQNWLKNTAKRKGLKYVLVAEYQPKSKRIHFHGFINDALEAVDSGTRLVRGIKKPVKLATLSRNGIDESTTQVVYNIPAWKFGFTTAIKAYNGSQACARYIMKYITKENQAVFGRYYWSSRNLTREPDTVYENTDWESLKLKEHTVPNTQINLKYYTFFPGEDDFFYNRSAENSAEILEFLKNCEKLENDE